MRIGDQQIGFLVAESAMKGFFTDGHGDRLRAIADQAAAAISNARFAGQVSGLAAAEERQRLARELHDAVNQTLWTAALTADSLLREASEDSTLRPRLERLRQLTRGALAEMRTLVLELRPAELSEAPLHELLEGLVTALESRKFLQVTVALDPVEFDSATRLAFYRVAQEALGNIAKHTQATEVEITLTSGENIELRIKDNGGGFDPRHGAGGPSRADHHARASRGRRGEARDRRAARPRDRSPAVGSRRMNVASDIRVVVVDDHDLLREGVTACLSGFDTSRSSARHPMERRPSAKCAGSLPMSSWSTS